MRPCTSDERNDGGQGCFLNQATQQSSPAGKQAHTHTCTHKKTQSLPKSEITRNVFPSSKERRQGKHSRAAQQPTPQAWVRIQPKKNYKKIPVKMMCPVFFSFDGFAPSEFPEFPRRTQELPPPPEVIPHHCGWGRTPRGLKKERDRTGLI